MTAQCGAGVDSLRRPGREGAPEGGEVQVAEDVDKNETAIGFVLSALPRGSDGMAGIRRSSGYEGRVSWVIAVFRAVIAASLKPAQSSGGFSKNRGALRWREKTHVRLKRTRQPVAEPAQTFFNGPTSYWRFTGHGHKRLVPW